MPFQLDKWNRSPRSPLVATSATTGIKVCFGRLRKGRRAVFLLVPERRWLWRTKPAMQSIGYWDIAKKEFVSTAPLLDIDVFLGVGEMIEFFEAEGASSGEFNICPACSKTRLGPKVQRDIGFMLRFF